MKVKILTPSKNGYMIEESITISKIEEVDQGLEENMLELTNFIDGKKRKIYKSHIIYFTEFTIILRE